MGCPTSFNDFDATWTRGKLSGLSRSGSQIGYDYNAFGQRINKSYSYTQKTSPLMPSIPLGTMTSRNQSFCYDQSGRLICENGTSEYYNEGSTTEKIIYLYDENRVTL